MHVLLNASGNLLIQGLYICLSCYKVLLDASVCNFHSGGYVCGILTAIYYNFSQYMFYHF